MLRQVRGWFVLRPPHIHRILGLTVTVEPHSTTSLGHVLGRIYTRSRRAAMSDHTCAIIPGRRLRRQTARTPKANVIKGVMIGGFALVASPAVYGGTGVKTFIVSQDGVVYEKDLEPQSLNEFQKMERFNPDASWAKQ